MQPAEEFALNLAHTGADDDRGAATPWFDAMFRDHYPRVVGLLARLVGDRGQAEEIAADVFCKLSRHTGPLQDRAQLVPWLYRVATNAGLDGIRSNSRRKRREEAAGSTNLHTASGDALQQMLRQERCERVRAILSALKPRDAQMLLLRANGLAYRELAETLGIQSASVGTLLARAEAEFERRYRARYGDDV
ncbi:MAG TPA: sigma-70 family RNA polymerase sigma factor [Bryobacteraceae bacterium]|nr:sigma-70 family RNA polymerase sigma factor [Bryobacteraceae bacterium]